MPHEVRIDGIVIFCSDPREGLWKLIKQQIIKPEEMFVKIGVLGGSISLANQETLVTEANFLLAQIHFAIATFSNVKRIIVVGHDCGYYKKILGTITVADKERDLMKITEFLRARFPNLVISTFLRNFDKPGFKTIA